MALKESAMEAKGIYTSWSYQVLENFVWGGLYYSLISVYVKRPLFGECEILIVADALIMETALCVNSILARYVCYFLYM